MGLRTHQGRPDTTEDQASGGFRQAEVSLCRGARARHMDDGKTMGLLIWEGGRERPLGSIWGL